MGGQNHQPTNRILTAASALLSQRVSDGFALVLTANSHLEDAIMLGMSKTHVADLVPELAGRAEAHLEEAVAKLRASLTLLAAIDEAFVRLLHAADCEHYTGNPLAWNVKAFGLRALFEGKLVRPSANASTWIELEERIKQTNILKTLAWEREQFGLLVEPTHKLISTMETGVHLAKDHGGREFVDALEDNRLPLRQYYAQVFSLWNHLQGMFLYSALIMTELYYRANGFPSLSEFEPTDTRMDVA